MTTLILRDASHWQPIISPDNESNELLRLYSDKVIAGYVLSGEPESSSIPLNLETIWGKPVVICADLLPSGVAAMLLVRDENGVIAPERSFVIRDAT